MSSAGSAVCSEPYHIGPWIWTVYQVQKVSWPFSFLFFFCFFLLLLLLIGWYVLLEDEQYSNLSCH